MYILYVGLDVSECMATHACAGLYSINYVYSVHARNDILVFLGVFWLGLKMICKNSVAHLLEVVVIV